MGAGGVAWRGLVVVAFREFTERLQLGRSRPRLNKQLLRRLFKPFIAVVIFFYCRSCDPIDFDGCKRDPRLNVTVIVSM